MEGLSPWPGSVLPSCVTLGRAFTSLSLYKIRCEISPSGSHPWQESESLMKPPLPFPVPTKPPSQGVTISITISDLMTHGSKLGHICLLAALTHCWSR